MSYKHQAQVVHHVLPPILGSLVELTPYQVRTFQKSCIGSTTHRLELVFSFSARFWCLNIIVSYV